MAEAFAIVGLASNVVQFVDAAGNLIAIAYEFYKSGSLATNNDIEERMNSLRTSLDILQHANSTPMDPELTKLVQACIKLSIDMTSLLAELKPDGQKHKLSQAVTKTVKTMRKRQEIKSIEGKLSTLREEICLHLTAIYRKGCSWT
jgi:uncharacterized protein Yka (UPF0111/DUF47 family)